MRFPALAFALFLGAAASAEEVTLTPDMLVAAGGGTLRTDGLALPDLSGLSVVEPSRTDASARLLRHITETTRANGHRGILYDNRDRGHSTLPEGAFPSLLRLRYGPGLRGMDFGLATRLHFPAVVLGNSSTALTHGIRARSLTRLAMTTPGTPDLVAGLAADNHLYLYPEHRDHDAVDLYPANWPYIVTTQGSSGSDRPFLDAIAMTLAAFPEDTMSAMRAEGLVVPTLQMILRRNLDGVNGPADYYGAVAHPSVFDGDRLRPERMIGHAAAITPETLPPAVRLTVISETFRTSAGLAGQPEMLFTTPAAVARVWRGPEDLKTITLSAAGTRARGEAPVSFRWVLLRGDPSKVEITPDPTGARADIAIRWHDAYEVETPHGPIRTSRVDIAVFAAGGPEPGAPAFLSVSFPTHEIRRYETGADGDPVLKSIDYDAVGRAALFDPMLHWSAPWVDEAIRNEAGDLVGWHRMTGGTATDVPLGPGGPGYRISPDFLGRPILGEAPR